MILNDSAFWDFTFDEFEATNIKLITNLAFGEAAETIEMVTFHSVVNHEQSTYNIWKVISGLINAQSVYIPINAHEIPSQAFTPINGKQLKLKTINFPINNKITIRRLAFYNLVHLQKISFNEVEKIEREAFSFRINSAERLSIELQITNQTVIEADSFLGVQRPVNVKFINSKMSYIPESSFKYILDENINNVIEFQNSNLDCFECKNHWMIRDKRNDTRVKFANCLHNKNVTLFEKKVRSDLVQKCNFF